MHLMTMNNDLSAITRAYDVQSDTIHQQIDQ